MAAVGGEELQAHAGRKQTLRPILTSAQALGNLCGRQGALRGQEKVEDAQLAGSEQRLCG